MGLFRRSRVNVDDFEIMKQSLESLYEQVDAGNAQREELRHRVDSIDHTNMTLTQQVGPVADLAAGIASLDTRLQELDHRVEPLVERADEVTDLTQRLDELKQRFESLSIELTNQITELSGDIDRLTDANDAADTPDEQRHAEPAVDHEMLDEVVVAQQRLANEQARYQIAFREDLARLADQIRHARR